MSVNDCQSVGSNHNGDEGAFVLSRHLPGLSKLWVWENNLSWEGVAAMGNNLIGLENLWIGSNEAVGQGIRYLGKLPRLNRLEARTDLSMQATHNLRTGP